MTNLGLLTISLVLLKCKSLLFAILDILASSTVFLMQTMLISVPICNCYVVFRILHTCIYMFATMFHYFHFIKF